MSVWELMVMVIAALFTAVPLCKIGNKIGLKSDGFMLALLVLIPITQLIYLYYLAFAKRQQITE